MTLIKQLVFFTTVLYSISSLAEDVFKLEKEVSEVEKVFAKSMAERDFSAFKTFLDPDAVFISGESVLRGNEEVAAKWQSFFTSEQAPFSWQPEQVAVIDDGTIALSTGPVSKPDGTVYAYYTSIWRKNEKGDWKIILDKGHKYCPPKPNK